MKTPLSDLSTVQILVNLDDNPNDESLKIELDRRKIDSTKFEIDFKEYIKVKKYRGYLKIKEQIAQKPLTLSEKVACFFFPISVAKTGYMDMGDYHLDEFLYKSNLKKAKFQYNLIRACGLAFYIVLALLLKFYYQ